MPVAATDLNAISNYAVTFTSFTMASLLGMSFAGLWANKLGLAKVVIFAIATLAIGSLVAGFAPNLAVLTARALTSRFCNGTGLGDHVCGHWPNVSRSSAPKGAGHAGSCLGGPWFNRPWAGWVIS